jgi:outer membrane protein assembly factor BamB
MSRKVSLAALFLVALVFANPVSAREPVAFQELAGWWSANPSHGGESAQLALQYVEKDGKPQVLLSAPALGVHGFSLGEVTIAGDRVDSKGLAFPLTWNAATHTLSGFIPESIAPVYNIPVEFKRSGPVEPVPPREWRAPRPTVLWRAETGAAVWAGLELDPANGTLFVGNENGVLSAIDRRGRTVWKFETGKPIRAQPRLLAGHVYVASDSGFLHKLDAATGAERWRADVGSGSEPRIPPSQEKTRYDRYASSVVADGKHLYIASRDKHLYALDVDTGRQVWRVAAGDIMTATPAVYRDTVIFAAYDGRVQAVSASDGRQRWSYDARLAVPGDLVVAGDRLLVGSRSYDLIALDAGSGRELWKTYYWFSWIESPPVVRDGVAYTGSSDATKIYAVNVADGSVRWKTSVPGWSWQRTAVNDSLVVAGTAGAGEYPGSRSGSLVALDRATGAVRWIHLDPPTKEILEAKKGWGFGASPVIAGDVVYSADLNGTVFAIDLKGPAT